VKGKKPVALSAAEARKAVRWAQSILGLRDWRISVKISDEPPLNLDVPPSFLGAASMSPSRQSALVWVSPKRHEGESDTMIATLFHEVYHIWGVDRGLTIEESGGSRWEFGWNILADVLVFAYQSGLALEDMTTQAW